jgi:HK97 family phage prohead protease
MECDFSGWATKADIRCTDGRTIMPNAFRHQDNMQVPLVWQHDHKNPENVLGHVLLENRDEGVYCRAFFNNTPKAQAAKESVIHKDINQMSIWANELMERSKRVVHGAIKEVSLVLAGANPGAVIDFITVSHSDGSETDLEGEAIITTGLKVSLEHDDVEETTQDEGTTGADDSDLGDKVAEEVKHQLELLHAAGDRSVQEIFDTLDDDQKDVVYYLLGTVAESGGQLAQSDIDEDDDTTTETDGQEGSKEMKHNVFESDADTAVKGPEKVISHDDMKSIIEAAQARGDGSMKKAVEAFAETHLEHVDVLFPEARNVSNTPELLSRRVEWVADLLGKVKKSPISRIKTMFADLTVPEARAKGYITGNLKKEEFFKVAKRVTEPTTIYKKQKLDRDDLVDITDFDVVAWMKAEMRLMLDEELARAILVGDGREADDEDKINEEKIRPIATDHELYTTQIYVDLVDASSSMTEVSDAIALNRSALRGSGLPTFYTTETIIARFMTQRDSLGRRLFSDLGSLATELRVSEIVPVEVLEETPSIAGILVNPVDYQVGATAGGEVSLFDDFDIDYNQYKYLLETRCSGALTKLKSAMVVNLTPVDSTLVVPAEPAFDGSAVTITNQTGVVYRNADTDAVINAAGSPYAVAEGTTYHVHAEPASSSYHFASSDDDDWYFTNEG